MKLSGILISALLGFTIVACSKDDPDPGPSVKDDGKKEQEDKTDPSKDPTYQKNPEIPMLYYAAPANTVFHRIGYCPYYRGTDASVLPDEYLKNLDIICYAFASIKDDYTVTLSQPSRLKTLVSRCHALGIKVLISFNGTSSTFVSMTSTNAGRQTFIKSIMQIVNDYNLDGVDNDWEYPSTSKGSDITNVYLMREFSNRLHAPGVGKLLTQAITSGKYSGGYRDAILDTLVPCVDWLNVMTYDDFATDPSVTTRNHASWSFFETAYKHWAVTRGFAQAKICMGLPCYGRPSGMTQSGTTKSYSGILGQGGDPDADEATVTATGYESGYTIFYNGRPTIAKKAKFCKDNTLAGYFFWEIGQDTTDDRSLIRAAYNATL